VRWFKAAADAGDREGLNNLAVMLDNGLGVGADPAAAQTLFERAARAGESGAAVNLALMLLRPGKAATAAARVEAYAWLNLAASLGHAQAATMRANLALLLSPEQVAEAQAKSLGLMKN
jgi:TPR repeat protein